jgi:hypothetical protein
MPLNWIAEGYSMPVCFPEQLVLVLVGIKSSLIHARFTAAEIDRWLSQVKPSSFASLFRPEDMPGFAAM